MAFSWQFIDGFDHYSSLTDLQSKWASDQSTPSSATIGSGFTWESGANRRGSVGYSLGIASGSALCYLMSSAFAQHGQIMCNAARSSANSRTLFAGYNTSVGLACRLQWNADGSFELFNQAGVSQGTSSVVANDTNTYHHVNLDFPLSNTASVKLYVDGILVKTWASVDTKPGSTASGFKEFWFGGSNGAAGTGTTFYIDDAGIAWGAVADSAFVIGGMTVETQWPLGNGAKTEWTNSSASGANNYSFVNEDPYSTAEYIFSTGGHTDYYTFTPTAGTGGSILTVQMSAYVKTLNNTTKTNDLRAQFRRSDTTEVFIGSFFGSRIASTSYEMRSTMFYPNLTSYDSTTQFGLLNHPNTDTTITVANVIRENAVLGLPAPATSKWALGYLDMVHS